MTLVVHWYDDALDDLDNILGYISERDTGAAQRLRYLIHQAVILAADSPYSGRSGRIAGTREYVIHPNYIVVYRVTDRIDVVSVLHSRQQYP